MLVQKSESLTSKREIKGSSLTPVSTGEARVLSLDLKKIVGDNLSKDKHHHEVKTSFTPSILPNVSMATQLVRASSIASVPVMAGTEAVTSDCDYNMMALKNTTVKLGQPINVNGKMFVFKKVGDNLVIYDNKETKLEDHAIVKGTVVLDKISFKVNSESLVLSHSFQAEQHQTQVDFLQNVSKNPKAFITDMQSDTTVANLISKWKTLASEALTHTPSSEVKSPKDQHLNDLAWFKGDKTWFDYKATRHSDALIGLRRVQKEMFKELQATFQTAFFEKHGFNMPESVAVGLHTQTMTDILGKDAGLMMDTNFYGAQVHLKENIHLTNKSQLSDYLVKTNTMAAVKGVQHTLHGFDTQISHLEGLKSKTEDKAVIAMLDKSIGAFKQKAQESFEAFKTTFLASLPNSSQAELVSTNIFDKAVAIYDASQVTLKTELGTNAPTAENKLQASNAIYARKLLDSDMALQSMNVKESHLKSSIEKHFPDFSAEKVDTVFASLVKQDLDGLSLDEVKSKLVSSTTLTTDELATLDNRSIGKLVLAKSDLDTAVKASILEQSSAAVFANEAYYSDSTLKAVVAGIQMGKSSEQYSVISHQASAMENFGDYQKEKSHEQLHHDEPVLKTLTTAVSSSASADMISGLLSKLGTHPEKNIKQELSSVITNSKYLFRIMNSALQEVPTASDSKENIVRDQLTVARNMFLSLQSIRNGYVVTENDSDKFNLASMVIDKGLKDMNALAKTPSIKVRGPIPFPSSNDLKNISVQTTLSENIVQWLSDGKETKVSNLTLAPSLSDGFESIMDYAVKTLLSKSSAVALPKIATALEAA